MNAHTATRPGWVFVWKEGTVMGEAIYRPENSRTPQQPAAIHGREWWARLRTEADTGRICHSSGPRKFEGPRPSCRTGAHTEEKPLEVESKLSRLGTRERMEWDDPSGSGEEGDQKASWHIFSPLHQSNRRVNELCEVKIIFPKSCLILKVQEEWFCLG